MLLGCRSVMRSASIELPMKVLITGAEGQVGRALIELNEPGATLAAVSHTELDITDRAKVVDCLRRHRPDVVVNAAAYTAVDRAETEPQSAERVNSHGPRHLAAAA